MHTGSISAGCYKMKVIYIFIGLPGFLKRRDAR